MRGGEESMFRGQGTGGGGHVPETQADVQQGGEGAESVIPLASCDGSR